MADGPGPPPDGAVLAAGRRLQVDAWTAKVVTALRHAGVRPILLKGPAIARWLYDDDFLARTYGDIDLLVSPTQRPRAEAVLRDMGFTTGNRLPALEPVHAEMWALADGRAIVDLHRVLHGMEDLPDQDVWDLVSGATRTCAVRGVEVDIPGPPVRTLHLALHLHVRDGPGAQAWRDLERGIARVDHAEWEQAADLARALGIDGDMAARLRALPEGKPLADRLRLPETGPDRYYSHQAVHHRRARPEVQSLAYFASRSGWAAKAAYARRKLLPPPPFMRQRHAIARRGRAGLLAAYAWRGAIFAVRAPQAVVQWRRIRRRPPPSSGAGQG